MASRREGKVQNPSQLNCLFKIFVFQNVPANTPWPGSSNQFWKTFAGIDTTDINGIDMGKNKESKRNAKKWRYAAIQEGRARENGAEDFTHYVRRNNCSSASKTEQEQTKLPLPLYNRSRTAI